MDGWTAQFIIHADMKWHMEIFLLPLFDAFKAETRVSSGTFICLFFLATLTLQRQK